MNIECWVRGEDAERIFKVKISRTETVTGLKEAVRNAKSKFHDVDADKLDLYSFPLPDHDGPLDELNQWSPRGQTKLNARFPLSKLFADPEKPESLIVVSPPSFDSRTIGLVPDLRLNCWVRGDTTDEIFFVDISSHLAVGDLKKVIKNEKSIKFFDMYATGLVLYKVSLPYNDEDSLDDILGAHTISSLGKSLRAPQTLSDVFTPPPPGNQLHLIVVGSLSVRCWIRGAHPVNSFEVQMSANARIPDLKNAIKANYRGDPIVDITPDRLTLYKISMDEEALGESLGALGSGHLLQGNEFLEKAFNDVPLTLAPCIVVEALTEKITKPLPSSYHYTGNGDPITDGRKAFLVSTEKEKPPVTGTPSTFRTRHRDTHRLKSIPCGRPREYEDGIPVTLLHPVFGQFVHDCQTIEVTAEDNNFVQGLAVAMSALYDGEPQRVTAVNNQFQRYNIHFIISETKTGYVTDADIGVNGHRYVIAEFKNETGNTSAEPYFQAIGYYLESTRADALKFPRSPLPCLLLAIFGPHIVFAGAAWNLRPTVQILSTPIAFHFHSTDTYNQLTVARHMAAFRKATLTLKEYYETLRATPLLTSHPVPSHMFPYPTSYKSRCHHDTEKHFQYATQLYSNKPIFWGIEDESDRVCIKFVRAYSSEAHQYLASLECAPVLRGFETIPGGWFMVVMDMLPDEFETLYDRKKPLPSSVFDNIAAKLKMFHDAGFVHGDVRDTNIMVSKSDETRFMIIDFDWAGRIQAARYPAGVSHQITRPAEARDGKEILPTHDIFMLDDIRSTADRGDSR